MMAVPNLLITGPVGVGKTAVALEASGLLEAAGVPHAVVDVDTLAWCFPPPADDRFNDRLALRNLAAIWANYRQAGATRLLLARVLEARAEVEGYRAAVPGAEITVVRLRAPVQTLLERVARRETGSGREWHLARAVELARLMDDAMVEDLLLETEGRSITEVAREVLRRSQWL